MSLYVSDPDVPAYHPVPLRRPSRPYRMRPAPWPQDVDRVVDDDARLARATPDTIRYSDFFGPPIPAPVRMCPARAPVAPPRRADLVAAS